MVVTRQGFTQAVGTAFAGLGFPAEGPSVYEFPTQMFNVGSDLTPINENFDKIVYGLTKWQPKINTKGVVKPDMVTVQGKDYQSAVDNMNLLFLKNNWSDALPLVPATPERVKWILTGTDLAPETVISPAGGVLPRGGIATVEQIAVALTMAGGRPEYLPVVIAAVQAITDPKMTMQSWNATTQDVFPALIINGPIAKQIRVGSGYGIMGPDPFHPAGQAIGRAVRLIQQNLGGAIPGVGTMATYSAGRTTNAVFAEDEDGLPKGWNSYAVDRGFKKDQNILTATLVNSFTQNGNTYFGTKETNDQVLMKTAKLMAAPNNHRWSNQVRWNVKNPDLVSGVVFIPRGTADTRPTASKSCSAMAAG